MPTIHFLGSILPSYLSLTISKPIIANWTDPGGSTIAFSATLSESKVAIQCETSLDLSSPDHIPYIYHRARAAIRLMTDLASLCNSSTFSVKITHFTDPDGNTHELRFDHEFDKLTKSVSLANIGEVFDVVIKEIPLFMALNDLMEALSDPLLCVVNCARML